MQDEGKQEVALALVPELMEEIQDLALARSSDVALLDLLAGNQYGPQVLQARADMIETLRFQALRATHPTDWVLNKTAEGEIAMCTKAAAVTISQFYGLSCVDFRPTVDGLFTPLREELGGGRFQLTGSCDAVARVTGRAMPGIRLTRRSDEKFTGRALDGDGKITHGSAEGAQAMPSDLASAVYTGLFTKAVKVCCDMAAVSRDELDSAWAGQFIDPPPRGCPANRVHLFNQKPKTTDGCRRGHGYGSGDERRTKGVSSEGVEDMRTILRETLLAITGGNPKEAQALLRTITSQPETATKKGFKGNDSVDRMAQDWQFDNAWKRLLESPEHGEAARKGRDEAIRRLEAAKESQQQPAAAPADAQEAKK